MNSTLDSDPEKTACFFFAGSNISQNSQSPTKSPIKLTRQFPKTVLKNLNLKRRNSQIELPRLQLYTEFDSSNREKRTLSNKLQTNPNTPSSINNTIYCKQMYARPDLKRQNSKESSPSQWSINNVLNLRQNILSRNGKPFLQCRPQQKLVTRIFGE